MVMTATTGMVLGVYSVKKYAAAQSYKYKKKKNQAENA